jgi:hypothetical protein
LSNFEYIFSVDDDDVQSFTPFVEYSYASVLLMQLRLLGCRLALTRVHAAIMQVVHASKLVCTVRGTADAA